MADPLEGLGLVGKKDSRAGGKCRRVAQEGEVQASVGERAEKAKEERLVDVGGKVGRGLTAARWSKTCRMFLPQSPPLVADWWGERRGSTA